MSTRWFSSISRKLLIQPTNQPTGRPFARQPARPTHRPSERASCHRSGEKKKKREKKDKGLRGKSVDWGCTERGYNSLSIDLLLRLPSQFKAGFGRKLSVVLPIRCCSNVCLFNKSNNGRQALSSRERAHKLSYRTHEDFRFPLN